LVASALCLYELKHQGAERRTKPGLCSLQTAVCTADLSLCKEIGQAKLAATLDMDSTVNHKQLVKASRQDTLIFRETTVRVLRGDMERYTLSDPICSRAEVKDALLACQAADFLHCYSDGAYKAQSSLIGTAIE